MYGKILESSSSGGSAAALREYPEVLVLDVREMHCGGCAANVRKVLENVASVQSANVNLANETAVVRIAVRLDEEDLMEARSVGTKDAADSSDASSSAAPTVKAVNGDISVQKIIESIKNKAKIEGDKLAELVTCIWFSNNAER